MSSFLNQVAKYFVERDEIALSDCCFVFPNRRAGTFFAHELSELCEGRVVVMPHITTMVDFVSRLVDARPLSQVESLFLLYKCYQSIGGNGDYEFDKFVRWGNIILHDFNDVDMAMADARQLFTNISDYREISSNYIDEDLREMLKKYFDMHFEAPDDEFWKNYRPSEGGDSEVKQSYLRLWQQLYELYARFNDALDGRTYMGKIYRDAAVALHDGDAIERLPWRRVVMVGFNMLTVSETVIFKSLARRKGQAMFFWDNASPVFTRANEIVGNDGATFINGYSKMFPMPGDFMLETLDTLPPVTLAPVPSVSAQARVAFDQLGTLAPDVLNSAGTAIILPDEALFLPLLNAVPKEVKSFNVTMGYSMRYSDIASLLRLVALAHRRARPCRDSDTEWEYYREDVKDVLSHPIIKRYYGKLALRISAEIDNNRLFFVPQSLFAGEDIAVLFEEVDISSDAIGNHLERLAAFVDGLNAAVSEPDEGEADVIPLQAAFYNRMSKAINEIRTAIVRHKTKLNTDSVFFLLERVTSSLTVPFEGMPLQGLQVMGLLESRCLDFDHLVILSVNERVLPGRLRQQSFVSDALRREFNLPTARNSEAMWSYHFYRLISRAKQVTLVYDSSMSSRVGSNEPSRFVEQLRLIYSRELKSSLTSIPYEATPQPTAAFDLEVPKDDHAMAYLARFLDKDSEACLSASSINCYFNCQLWYYLRYVEDLGDQERDDTFMPATIFGTIVHDTLQELYYPESVGGGINKVTVADIENFKKNERDRIITRKVNELYLHRPADRLDEKLHGDALINSESIRSYVNRVLDYDINLLGDGASLEVLECEQSHSVRLPLGDGREFNFTFKVDRIDRIAGTGTIRIIDYKTGRDEVKFANVDELFDESKYRDRRHAALQLMLYCYAYDLERQQNEEMPQGPLKPMIYKMRDIENSGLKLGKTTIEDYRAVEGFWEVFKSKMADFFDRDIPFRQVVVKQNATEKEKKRFTCFYCPFVDLCAR